MLFHLAAGGAVKLLAFLRKHGGGSTKDDDASEFVLCIIDSLQDVLLIIPLISKTLI